MNILRALPVLCLLVACGPSTPSPDATPDGTAEPTTKPTATSAATMEPTADPEGDVASFAAAPTASLKGSELRLTYEGATVALTESALVPAGSSYKLRFRQPAAEGTHLLELAPKELVAGKPASFDGKGGLVLHLMDGRNADGTFKLVDVTSSCGVTGTLTIAEIPKAGGKAKGSVDITIKCEGTDDLKLPFTLQGDFADVPLAAK